MKVAFISDIHGNKTALDAVLDDMPSVDGVVCVGDIVGYGGRPVECLETIREVADVVVKGNHDKAAVRLRGDDEPRNGAYMGAAYAADKLSSDQLDWLDSLPEHTTAFDVVRVAHSHPERVDEYVYPRSFTEVHKYIQTDKEPPEKVLALGHTHVQHSVDMEKYESEGIVLNPGSVGQPRDGNVYAAYSIVDTDTGEVDERRVSYDIQKAQRHIRDAGLPESSAARLGRGE